MSLTPLPEMLIETLVRNALAEDLGHGGDVTTDSIVPPERKWKGVFVPRKSGIVAGIDCARMAFKLLDKNMAFDVKVGDGGIAKLGGPIALVHGNARAVLTAERVALNFLCHLSGIATATRHMVDAVKPHKARIRCTRKTTPGLRVLEKYAVRAGGGVNHRFGLDDAVLIKDNHIAIAGSVTAAVYRAREGVGTAMTLDLEVDNLDQLQQALDLPINGVLLDNMDTTTLKKAVEMVGGRFTTEASGGVTIETVNAIAATGVDFIAVGSLTHSAPVLDIGLDETSI